jgi:hypothetical protein
MATPECSEAEQIVTAAILKRVQLTYDNGREDDGRLTYDIYPINPSPLGGPRQAVARLNADQSQQLSKLLTFIANAVNAGTKAGDRKAWPEQRQAALYSFWIMHNPMVAKLIGDRDPA